MITASHSMTAVGLNAESTAAAIRAGISRLQEWNEYTDIQGNPVLAASIPLASADADAVERLQGLTTRCLGSLLEQYFNQLPYPIHTIHVLIGVAPLHRPGSRYEGEKEELAKKLRLCVQRYAKQTTVHVIVSGNPSALDALIQADKLLQTDPYGVCLVGAVDSLLDEETLDWFESAERLKTATFGRNHGLSPGEAVGFFAVETKIGALSRARSALAVVRTANIAHEPGAITSQRPSIGEGLTTACRAALLQAGSRPENIATVMGDLNGEFFRSKEWAYAALRCLPETDTVRSLWHPADCMGDVGAASGAVLVNLAAVGLSRGWAKRQVLIFCSDDWGNRGIALLDKG